MALHPRIHKLGQALVRAQVIDQLQLESALATAEQWGARLPKVIVEMRVARESAVVGAIAAASNLTTVDLAAEHVEPAALAKLDALFCQQKGVFPYQLQDNGRTLVLAMADPTDLDTLDAVASRTRCRVRPHVVAESQLQKAVQHFYFGEPVSLEAEPDQQLIADIDELKLVDSNGRTLMIPNAVLSLKEQALPGPAPRAAPPPPAPAPPRAAPPPAQPAPAQPRSAPPVARPPSAPAAHAAPAPIRSAPPAARPLSPAAIPTAKPAPAQASPAAAAPAAVAPVAPPAVAQASESAIAAQLAAIEQQLAAMRQTQEHTQRMIRALAEALIDKRVVTPDELRSRMKQG